MRRKKTQKFNLLKELKTSFSIITLKKKTINQVADNGSTWLAVILFGFWSLVAGIIIQDYMSAIGWFVEAIFFTWIITLLYYLGGMLFKSKAEFMEIYKPWGYAQLVVGISFLINKLFTTNLALLISLLLEVWCIIIAYKIIKTESRLKPWKALIIALIPIIILIIIVMTNSLTLLSIILDSGLVNGLLF